MLKLSGMMFVLGWSEPAKRVMAMGGILGWKDGRNMSDVHASLFQCQFSLYGIIGTTNAEGRSLS
jgi:hypothetical protein